MTRLSRLLAIAVVAVPLSLAGCTAATPDGGTCVVPRVQVEPSVARPGDTVAMVSSDLCDVALPAGGWLIVAGTVGGGGPLAEMRSSEQFDGSFRVEFVLPDDFPAGEAYLGIQNWDYSSCAGTPSCAGSASIFTVTP